MPSAKLEGQEKLNMNVNSILKAVNSKSEGIYLKGAEVIRDDAKRKAPLGATGNLRRGIVAKILRRRGSDPAPAMVGIDFKIAPHAHLIEYGTVNMSAQPFFRPAVDGARRRIEQIFKDGFKGVINGAIK